MNIDILRTTDITQSWIVTLFVSVIVGFGFYYSATSIAYGVFGIIITPILLTIFTTIFSKIMGDR